ncbi:hypothetical protein [Chryseolinea lacunae]|uniref:DUF3887 domain-containing protein n=1 Tax=Chryseolinea lacunae TaxID=2801331 RepID=A0ABS1KXD8_9BACT|nr:hypothetical protein [Chryseolinea lacunae]MBL0744120.1 hypothetical protein [Chryseolinea lacunae]
MKTTVITFAALSLSLTAFMKTPTTTEKPVAITSDQMAERVVAALRQSSAQQYADLFPALSDFHAVMEESADVYGNSLQEAQSEFGRTYQATLVPSVKASFESLIARGKEKGIDWRSVRYVGIELAETAGNRFGAVPVTIVFASDGKEFRLRMDNAMVFNGQWKVSQFIRLV